MTEPIAAELTESALPGAETVDLPLGQSFGTATVRVRTDWITGRTLYEVAAEGISGAITVYPDPNPAEDDPGAADELLIKFGNVLKDSSLDRDRYTPYPQPMQVDSYVMVGGTAARPHQLTDEGFYTVARRRRDDGTRDWLPDRFEHRLSAVVRAVGLHWLARDDLTEVKAAHARYYAPRHIHTALRQARSLQNQITGLAAARDKHLAQAEKYGRLVSEPVPHPDMEGVRDD